MKKQWLDSILRILFVLFIGLFVSGIFILVAGESPIVAYKAMFKGAFVGKGNIVTTIRWSIPYIVAGIASAMAIRVGLFNMGLEGCIYLGGFSAAIAGAYIQGLPTFLHILVCILIAMIVGALWVTIPAILKAYFNVNEVIFTWMLSYIALLLCEYLANKFQRPEDVISAVQQIRTPEILESAKLFKLFEQYQLSAGIFIVILLIVVYYLFANRSKKGYEHKIIGLAPGFAEYGGVDIRKMQMYSLIISGAIGALAGAIEVLGVHNRYIHGFAKDMGSNGVMVSLMGRLSPVGIPISGVFMGAIQNGSRAMARETGVSLDTVRILISVIIITVTADGLYNLVFKRKKTSTEKARD